MISKIDISTQNIFLYRSVWCKNLVFWSLHQNLDSPKNPKSDFKIVLSLHSTWCIFKITGMISIIVISKEKFWFYWKFFWKIGCFWSFRLNVHCLNVYTNARISDLTLLPNSVPPSIIGMISITIVSLEFLLFWKNLWFDFFYFEPCKEVLLIREKFNFANNSVFSVIKHMFLGNHKCDFSHRGLKGVFRNCRGVRIPFKSEWTKYPQTNSSVHTLAPRIV